VLVPATFFDGNHIHIAPFQGNACETVMLLRFHRVAGWNWRCCRRGMENRGKNVRNSGRICDAHGSFTGRAGDAGVNVEIAGQRIVRGQDQNARAALGKAVYAGQRRGEGRGVLIDDDGRRRLRTGVECQHAAVGRYRRPSLAAGGIAE